MPSSSRALRPQVAGDFELFQDCLNLVTVIEPVSNRNRSPSVLFEDDRVVGARSVIDPAPLDGDVSNNATP
jgi:hypothetical protein